MLDTTTHHSNHASTVAGVPPAGDGTATSAPQGNQTQGSSLIEINFWAWLRESALYWGKTNFNETETTFPESTKTLSTNRR